MGKLRHRQLGYLFEIPLILMTVGIFLSILLPNVSPLVGKILVVVAALIWIGGLYYMIVTPGWLPGQGQPSRLVRRKIAFVGATLAIAVAAGFYIFVG